MWKVVWSFNGKSLQCDRVFTALRPPALPPSAPIGPNFSSHKPSSHHCHNSCDRSISHGLRSLSRHCPRNNQSPLPIPSASLHSIPQPSVTACRPTVHRAFYRVISPSTQPLQQRTTWQWRFWRWEYRERAAGCESVRNEFANTVGL